MSILSSFNKGVDLGLSVNWAKCNLGASSCEQYGDYYAWGECRTKNRYSWDNYIFSRGTERAITKYSDNPYSCDYDFCDHQTRLSRLDDVATQMLGSSLLGGGERWRIPTRKEFRELIEECDWEWTTYQGIDGCRIKGRKPSVRDNWIFLPAAGYKEEGFINDQGVDGAYFSSDLTQLSSCAAALILGGGWPLTGEFRRCLGCTIRPVIDKRNK